MDYKVYSIRDAKTSFANPFVDVSDESAIRGFGLAFSNPTGLLCYAPEDFSLYCIGVFDSTSGHLTEQLPRFVCDATIFVRSDKDA